MSEIHVSPIDGENVLLVNGFRIVIDILDPHDDPVLVYHVVRKDVHISMFSSLQQAVKWCRD